MLGPTPKENEGKSMTDQKLEMLCKVMYEYFKKYNQVYYDDRCMKVYKNKIVRPVYLWAIHIFTIFNFTCLTKI